MALKSRIITKFSLLFSLFLCSQLIIAQQGDTREEEKAWHKGTVFLDTGDSINGLVKYNFKTNKIEYQNGKDYRILLPGKFIKIKFVSSIDSSMHTFDVFKIETSQDYYRPYFFEVIDTLGKIKLIRQYYWIEQVSSIGSTGFFVTRKEKVIQLYRLKQNNTATSYKPRKKKVLRSMKDRKKLVKEYVYENDLSFVSVNDVIKIVKYYNSLFNDSIDPNL